MRNIIRIANNFIVKHNVRSLPLDFNHLEKLCARLGYRLLPFGGNENIIKELAVEHYTKYAAFTYRHLDIRIVFFDEKLSTSTRHFAIAHETGHIYLNHNYQGTVGYTKANTVQEHEANTFAYQLLAPLCVLNALNITSVRDIEQYTLLDTKTALYIKTKLLFYKPSEFDDAVLKLHGVIRLKRKHLSKIITILLSAAVGCVLTLLFYPQQSPQATEPPSSTVSNDTADFIQKLKAKNNNEPTIVEYSFESASATTSAVLDEIETVYITPHGERYHKEKCYHIKDSICTAVPLGTATENGYTPCKNCFE